MLILRRLPRVGRRTRPAPLPDALRRRLLSIPAAAPSQAALVPRPALGASGLAWLLPWPMTPLAASFVLVVALSLAWGNPYRLGARTLDRLQSDATPAAFKIRTEAAQLAATLAGWSAAALDVVPGAGLRASRSVTVRLAERLYDEPEAAERAPAPGK